MRKNAVFILFLTLSFVFCTAVFSADWPPYTDLPAWEAYFEGGANVDEETETGYTALHYAVGRSPELVKLLLRHGAEVDYRQRDGISPLMLAVTDQQYGFASVPLLIAAGADVNAVDHKGRGVLVRVWRFDGEIVKQLLDAGVTVPYDCHTRGQRDPQQAPLVVMAGTKNLDPEGARLILDAGPDICETFTLGAEEFYEEDAFNLCVGCANPVLSRLFLQRGIIRFTPEQADSRVMFSGVVNDPGLMREFLDAGANPNAVSPNGVPILFTAIKNNEKSARLLLARGAEVNAAPGHFPPLLAAVEMEHESLLRELLAAGADVNAVLPKTGETPIFTAVKLENPQVYEILLAAGADVHAKTKTGETMLTVAARAGHLSLCQKLLAAGVDINAACEKGWRPVFAALDAGHADLVRFLVENGASLAEADAPTDLSIMPPLWMAAKTGDLDLCRFLIKHGVRAMDAPQDKWPLLHFAALGGNTDICAMALEFNPDVNVLSHSSQGSQTALRFTLGADPKVIPNAVAVCEFLIARGADVNIPCRHGYTSLWVVKSQHGVYESPAPSRRQCRMYQILLAAGADIHVARMYEGWTADKKRVLKETIFINAVLKEDTKFDPFTAKYLQIQSGRYVNAVTPDSLCVAAAEGDIPRIKRLLAGGKDIRLAEQDGETALHFAARAGQVEACKFLAENGADVNAPGIHGGTPLHYAAAFGHVAVIEALLAAGADINRPDTTGKADDQQTMPLHWAVDARQPAAVETLVRRGADLTRGDNRRRVPFLLAVEYMDDAVCEAFIKGGMDLNATVPQIEWKTAFRLTPLNPARLAVLQRAGLDFNARDRNGDTLLHGHLQNWPIREAVIYMLENGCDPALRNHAGHTPAEMIPHLRVDEQVKNRVRALFLGLAHK